MVFPLCKGDASLWYVTLWCLTSPLAMFQHDSAWHTLSSDEAENYVQWARLLSHRDLLWPRSLRCPLKILFIRVPLWMAQYSQSQFWHLASKQKILFWFSYFLSVRIMTVPDNVLWFTSLFENDVNAIRVCIQSMN